MHLVYSTQDLGEAEQVAAILARAGVQVHVSNRRTAEALGPQLSRFPASIGVWVTPSQLEAAQLALVASGLIKPRVARVPTRLNPWVSILVAALVAALIAAAGYGL